MNVKLSPPWNTYGNEIKALFSPDPEIKVGPVRSTPDGECDYEMQIIVSNNEKFVALNKVLSPVVYFGNVSLRIALLCNVDDEDSPYIAIYETIFKGNPLLKDIKIDVDQVGTKHAYVRFQPEVLQFYNDDLTDYNGNWSGLAQDIAREIFADNTDPYINFCTAAVNENESEEK